MNERTINRADFIRRLVGEAGLSYVDARKAFDSVIRQIEEGIITGSRVNFGRVAALKPVKLPPRVVHMGFERKGNKFTKTSKTYYLGSRTEYKVSVYRGFKRAGGRRTVS